MSASVGRCKIYPITFWIPINGSCCEFSFSFSWLVNLYFLAAGFIVVNRMSDNTSWCEDSTKTGSVVVHNPVMQYLSVLKPGEKPKPVMVAAESHALRMT